METYISEGVLPKLVDVNQAMAQPSSILDENSAQVNTAAQEIAAAIQQITEGSSDQTKALTTTTAEMEH